jgi:AraC-like DNA-binding protein
MKVAVNRPPVNRPLLLKSWLSYPCYAEMSRVEDQFIRERVNMSIILMRGDPIVLLQQDAFYKSFIDSRSPYSSSAGKKPSDVYLEVGFEDLSHFSFAFKKEFGKAPSLVGAGT